ncbi:hypothetical protein ABH957_000787 [Bacillus sp. RC242]|uniref:Uncharacterized protein n=1 Tax=Bacillus mycoides TaxID=1405 RepID=A0A654BMT1_BACMY|nr:hypothetical protein BACI71_70564 [Bacillus mycoides]
MDKRIDRNDPKSTLLLIYLCWLREEEGVYSYCEMSDGGNVICCVPEKEL